jgi:hypothetical protein
MHRSSSSTPSDANTPDRKVTTSSSPPTDPSASPRVKFSKTSMFPWEAPPNLGRPSRKPPIRSAPAPRTRCAAAHRPVVLSLHNPATGSRIADSCGDWGQVWERRDSQCAENLTCHPERSEASAERSRRTPSLLAVLGLRRPFSPQPASEPRNRAPVHPSSVRTRPFKRTRSALSGKRLLPYWQIERASTRGLRPRPETQRPRPNT